MTKWNSNIVFISLMNDMQWEKRDDWTAENVGAELLVFIEWLRNHEQYLIEPDIQAIFHNHYFTPDLGNKNRGYYFKLNQARTAMLALYKREEDFVKLVGEYQKQLAELKEIISKEMYTKHDGR